MSFVDRLASGPRVYDAIQRLAGSRGLRELLSRVAFDDCPESLVDLGGGTGFARSSLPEGVRYICLDTDPRKLAGLRRRWRGARAILADAGSTGLRDRSLSVACCVNVSHHLGDEELTGMLKEAARICTKRFVFLDAVRVPGRLASSLLWRLDRGRHPRSEEELRARLGQSFRHERSLVFSQLHRYLLWIGSP